MIKPFCRIDQINKNNKFPKNTSKIYFMAPFLVYKSNCKISLLRFIKSVFPVNSESFKTSLQKNKNSEGRKANLQTSMDKQKMKDS